MKKLKWVYNNVIARGVAIYLALLMLALLCVLVIICLALCLPTFGKSMKALDFVGENGYYGEVP